MFALQPEMKVFSGSANRELAHRICNYIGVPLGQAIEEGGGGKCGHIIADLEIPVIMKADAIPKNQGLRNQEL